MAIRMAWGFTIDAAGGQTDMGGLLGIGWFSMVIEGCRIDAGCLEGFWLSSRATI